MFRTSERSSIAGGTGATPEALIAFVARFGATADPRVRQRLVDAHIRYELLRFLRYRSQTALSQGRRPGAEASVMKLFYAGHLKKLGDLSMSIQGVAGSLLGPDAPAAGTWQQQLLSAPSIRIAGGSDEVQRNIMGERVLGLPGEPRVDKGVAWRDTQRQG